VDNRRRTRNEWQREAVPEPAPPSATVLHPAGRLLWRSAREAQVEVGGQRLVLDGVDSAAVRHLLGRPRADGEPPPTAPSSIDGVQRELLDAGLLWPAREATDDLRRSPPRPRLAAELTALSARAGEAASELLSARRHCTVVVHGGGRAGPHIAAILAAAGVGRVHVAETTLARLQHAVPGGLLPADEGRPLADAAAAAVARHAPEADCLPPAFGDRPDLVVLAVDEPVDDDRRDALHARSAAHLLVRLASDHGTVGPLVLPALTSCLRCADLHRLDRDPAWNALAVQLGLPHRATGVSEVALATVVAGLAAMQALDFLDGGRPATIEGTLELHPPDWRVRRRSWPAHPDCDCMPSDLPGGAA
jgi:hypothetical protein